MGAHIHFPRRPSPGLSLNLFDTGRCTRTAFIEIIFFVWCTLIAQIILTTRYGTVLSLISIDPHLIRFTFTGLKDIRHYDEEHHYRRSLRVHNHPSVCVGVLHDSIGSERSRYGVHLCGHLFSGRGLLVLITFTCRESSATTTSYPPHGIPIMCLHQTSEGGNCLHGHLALLRFVFFSLFFSEESHLNSFA